MKKNTKIYVVNILIALGVGALSAFLTRSAMMSFDQLNQPPLSPPKILFPIVWTILYVLMGIGISIVQTSPARQTAKNSALKFYVLQLIFNFFWSIFFFNAGLYLFSFFWLIAMLILIIIMTVKFYKIKPIAAYLQIPYIIWTTFASYLNLAIYFLNR